MNLDTVVSDNTVANAVTDPDALAILSHLTLGTAVELVNEPTTPHTTTVESPKAGGRARRVAVARPTRVPSKTQAILKELRRSRGATAESLMEMTGWQAHSLRGFLSGTVRKKLGLTVTSDVGKDGKRRYRIPAKT